MAKKPYVHQYNVMLINPKNGELTPINMYVEHDDERIDCLTMLSTIYHSLQENYPVIHPFRLVSVTLLGVEKTNKEVNTLNDVAGNF